MNKILIAAVALATFGSVAAQAADGRDPTVYGAPATAQGQVVEGRNATLALPTVSDAYINQAVEANARSTR
ncbi:hypothetical protein KHC23_21170 [Ancylobacter dichloromethanicus]|uniref:DUF4148 domain-containing protein n=1 Tax=Ancylobacter dichloromethanicus TaxID=518825 RepID=A0A9W6J5Q9_9HYPH|nr:hypothetical protein [Ancylobacter dichloromethanicus]MBS7556145.1 hypothetical protein [Ancylobacter dichloromethanicus]GLK69899.1 hypothetical protein GCM10017643_00140 [Ancylobacter dichloromethanicus]